MAIGKDGIKRIVANNMRSFGDADVDKKIIRVNKRMSKTRKLKGGKIVKKKKGDKRKPELLDSILHEELHMAHPDKSEQEIKRMTKKGLKNMTPKREQRLRNLFN